MNNQLPLMTTCCFCFKLHQGFMNIIYIDIARLFWGILYSLIIFTKTEVSILDYFLNSFMLFSITMQTYYSIKSLNRGIPKNDYKIYKKYFKTKLCYITLNFIQVGFQDLLDCIFFDSRSDICSGRDVLVRVVIALMWTALELYFSYVVYSFYSKTIKGFYGQIGFPAVFIDYRAASQNFILKNAVILEMKGIKIKNKGEFIEKIYNSFPIFKKEKAKSNKNSIKKNVVEEKNYSKNINISFQDLTLYLLGKSRPKTLF